ncbi:secreted protein [Stachybotrys elegans]|uniref:Secreted protein n=1 Tax=Stachybotrys elegans TaxID=80388 RepID=A0A8K0SGK9_9HYPO|nr:secreted protein [Stachybotrys elegans]
MQSSLKAIVILGALSVTQAFPAKRDIISALPGSADEIDLRFQPLLDFDRDGCYNTAAIDSSGYTNPGLSATGTPEGRCRDPPQLQNSNVYSRRRCNNGYCAVMYEYYFEKDQAVRGSFLGGHRHDWENIVVFSQGNSIIRVAASCHGGYGDASNSFPASGTRPYLVYHKDGISTHCFRFANGDDIAGPENHFGQFYTSPLISWDRWPSVDLRNRMLAAWSGGVGPKLDGEFGDNLRNAAGDGVPGFDPYLDA